MGAEDLSAEWGGLYFYHKEMVCMKKNSGGVSPRFLVLNNPTSPSVSCETQEIGPKVAWHFPFLKVERQAFFKDE